MEETIQKLVQVQSPGATGGRSTVRKKVSKKPKIQREPQIAIPPRQQQQPIPSGGWKIAKRTGKIIAGGGTGAGILGWAVSSGPDAAASTVAFIHTLF